MRGVSFDSVPHPGRSRTLSQLSSILRLKIAQTACFSMVRTLHPRRFRWFSMLLLFTAGQCKSRPPSLGKFLANPGLAKPQYWRMSQASNPAEPNMTYLRKQARTTSFLKCTKPLFDVYLEVQKIGCRSLRSLHRTFADDRLLSPAGTVNTQTRGIFQRPIGQVRVLVVVFHV